MRRRRFLTGVGALGIAGTALGGRGSSERVAPPSIDPVASLEIEGANDFETDATGTTAYVAATTGLVVVDVSTIDAPEVLAEVRDIAADRPAGPLDFVYDATVDGDTLLATAWRWAGDRERGALALFDVSDPSAPERLDVLKTEYPPHNVALDGDLGLSIGSGLERWPLVVLDASGGALDEVTRWSVIDADGAWADLDMGVRRLHDVYLRGRRAYLAYWDAGTWVMDLSEPSSPETITHFGTRDPDSFRASATTGSEWFGPEVFELPGNATAARPNGDETLVAVSKEAWDAGRTDRVGGPGGIAIWDVSDAGSPRRATTLAPLDAPGQTKYAKNFGWRGEKLYTAWRDHGVRVFDLSDPDRPLELARWDGGGPSATIHSARPVRNGFGAVDMVDVDSEGEVVETLYLFRDPGDGGADPAPTVGEEYPIAGDTTAEPGTTDTTTSEGTVATGGRTTDRTASREPTTAGTTGGGTGPTTSAAPTTPGSGVPGFTAVTALAGLGALAWRTVRRRRDDGE